MNASIKLGRIWGIPIGLNASWFLIFLLLTFSLSTGYFPQEYPNLSALPHWLLGLFTSLLFFASVLAHELGHAWVALRNNIPVKRITLFIFGGVAEITQEPKSPGAEFRIAIAGPLVSLALAVFFAGTWLVDQAIPFLGASSLYLLRINAILALFNLIPGFPLDGGRVLRSIVWKLTGSYPRATHLAASIGQVVAFGFIAWGIFTIFQGQVVNGLWTAFIGWFLQNAAASSFAQTKIQESLTGVKVSQAMVSDCSQVPSLVPLSQLVEERVLSGGQRCFFVTDNGKLEGTLTLSNIVSIPQPKWRFTTTGQAMMPFRRMVQVDPNTDLLSAMQIMNEKNIAQVPVVENGELVGMLSREQVAHYLRTRSELGI